MNEGVRYWAVLLAAWAVGCQAVAGIDDRSIAPELDTGAADTGATDTSLPSDSGSPMPDSGGDLAAPVDTTVAVDSAMADTAKTDSAPLDADAGESKVVINEVRASGGGDYLELFNAGTAEADLGGFGVTGTEDSGAFSTPIRFSAGEKLAPGGHLLILAGMTVAPSGPQTACGGPPRCYFAPWGISQSRGETLRLVRIDDSVVNEVAYPIDGHADGQSWGRLPDGSSTFSVMKPTPSAANAGL